MEKLEYLKAVFSEKGAEGVGEKLESTDRDTLRTVTVAAGLSLRAGGKRRSVAELRSALAEHIASAPGADDEEQAGNLRHSFCRPLCSERRQYPHTIQVATHKECPYVKHPNGLESTLHIGIHCCVMLCAWLIRSIEERRPPLKNCSI